MDQPRFRLHSFGKFSGTALVLGRSVDGLIPGHFTQSFEGVKLVLITVAEKNLER